MCGGDFTGFSHAWRIALQPFCFLCRSVVHVCLCVYPRLCLSALAHIQNGKGKNNRMSDNITDHKNMLVKKSKTPIYCVKFKVTIITVLVWL